ncbi:sodium:proton antiporter [Acidipila sp. EB88]|uniref:cation:proton antiporter n=1 Tax=Acidipila sp. EB88 TaxID=2305226 RepID=UPI000F5D89E9|nr:cation:proton antiporter [Acidipila sp. EB88]RRA49502.1 sodium:proton antiporter [Acidipila sp. EB88]
MTAFALASIFISVAALLSFANHRIARVPFPTGMTMLSLLLATLLLSAGKIAGFAAAVHSNQMISVVAGIDFNRLVLHGMLAFLLFAGALQIDAARLLRQKWPVLALSIVSTAVSTVVVALLCRAVLPLLGLPIPMSSALLLGAVLSPTDPVAALAILRKAGVAEALETQLSGEALFNDAVGAVLFIVLLETAHTGQLPPPGVFAGLLLREAGLGIVLGLLVGLVGALLIKLTDAYRTEILLTLALCMGGYALADALHASAPLEAVVCGLVLGGTLHDQVFSKQAQDYVDKFWDLVDGILNALLFLLLGLELVVVELHLPFLLAGALVIPLVLLARVVSVAVVMVPWLGFCRKLGSSLAVMTWGGMRGALSVALALSLPASPERALLLTITYVVVVFAIVVQGLTIGKLAQRVGGSGAPAAEDLAC